MMKSSRTHSPVGSETESHYLRHTLIVCDSITFEYSELTVTQDNKILIGMKFAKQFPDCFPDKNIF